jgi:tRNA (guanine-N(7)-)-methyltransferase
MPESGRADAKAANDPGRLQQELLQPDDLPRLLAQPHGRLEVEIGCGNGHFMAEHCALNPESLFIGVDVKKKRCVKAQKKIGKRELANARVIHGSAEAVMERLPDGSVDSFHLYFPDPWPKARHRRRRFLRKGNLDSLLRKLKTGGVIFFVTDFFDYYFHTKVLLLLREEVELSGQPPGAPAYHSVFAQRFTERGKQVRSLTARKTGRSRSLRDTSG